MNEFKGTPGPWDRDCGTVFKLNTDKFPVNRFTAQLDRGYGEDGKRISNEEVIHNATLMAAAPDLLYALTAALEELDAYAWVAHPKGADGAVYFNVTRSHARAAIAKALGE